MTKIAFMFPGQGSVEAGMGREVAEAVPEAMAVFDEASDAAGMDLKKLCFESPVEDLVDTEVQQPALVTTCLSLDAALRAARHPARRGRRPLGRRVLRARRCEHALRPRRDHARARARARDGRGGAAASGLDGGDPRARRRGGRGALPQDPQRVAGELQLPRPARHLGRDAFGRRGDRRGDARRRAARDQAARVRCVPLAARRARSGTASSCGREGASRREQGGVHVDRDRAHRGGARATAKGSSSS